MAREQLFAGPQSLLFVGSEDRRHRDALRQVSYYVEQQAHGVSIPQWGYSRTVLCIRRQPSDLPQVEAHISSGWLPW